MPVSDYDPLGRFTGLADVYARHRPAYPPAAVEHVLRVCGLRPGAVVADVGCGTGISSRQFAAAGLRVLGVEPNEDMRRQAEAAAEATGLADGSVDAVLAAQAFHWFEPEPTLREFCRLLKPGGWVALLWNERDERDPFTAALGDVIRTAPGAGAMEGRRHAAGAVLLTHPLFTAATRETFYNEQVLGEDGLVGRSCSHSYAPREPAAAAAFVARLRDLFAREARDGVVTVRYQTSVYTARRA